MTKDSEPAISGPSTVRRAAKLRDENPKARMSRWTNEVFTFAFSDVTCIYACRPDRIAALTHAIRARVCVRVHTY